MMSTVDPSADPFLVTAARFQLGLETPESLRLSAEQLLAGTDPPASAVKIAIEQSDWMMLFEPMVVSVCDELGVDFPTPRVAASLATADTTARIASGSIAPRDGLDEIRRIFDAVAEATEYWQNYETDSDQVAGSEFELDEFLGLFWTYEHVDGLPDGWEVNGKYGADAIAELDTMTVSLAKRWLAAH